MQIATPINALHRLILRSGQPVALGAQHALDSARHHEAASLALCHDDMPSAKLHKQQGLNLRYQARELLRAAPCHTPRAN